MRYKFYLKYIPLTTADVADFTNGSDHILFDEQYHQFYPGFGRDTTIEYDIWDHKYRRKFNGELVFFNNTTQTDYTYLDQIAKSTVEIAVKIEQQTCDTGLYQTFWDGYFTIVDGKWDADRGTLTVTPSPDDEYRHLEEQGDVSVNLMDETHTIQATLVYPVTTVEIISTTVPNATTHADFEAANPNYPDTYRSVSGDDWDYYTDCGDEPVDVDNKVLKWEKQLSPVKLTDDFVADACDGGFSTPSCTMTPLNLPARGIHLTDAINAILSNILTITYKSTFFNNDTVVGGGSGGTANYVTSVDPNPLNNLVLYQKSDTKSTSDPATKGEISFNEMMSLLKDMFNVDWFIDDDGNFRIEHYSYWDASPTSDTDLTTLDSGKWINKKNKWEYERVDMPNIERFTFMEAYLTDFIGKDITYSNLTTGNRYKDNVKERNLPVTTDIIYVTKNEADISNEGWVLLQCNAIHTIESEVGELSGYSLPNNHLSWANLHNAYWRHGRVIRDGVMNGVASTFLSWVRSIKQTEITYPECCDTFDPMATKTTELGDGEVRSAEYRLIDGSVKTVFFFS